MSDQTKTTAKTKTRGRSTKVDENEVKPEVIENAEGSNLDESWPKIVKSEVLNRDIEILERSKDTIFLVMQGRGYSQIDGKPKHKPELMTYEYTGLVNAISCNFQGLELKEVLHANDVALKLIEKYKSKSNAKANKMSKIEELEEQLKALKAELN